MDALYAQMLPYLPPTLQEILLNPPNLSKPQSFFPLIKALIPYTQWIIVLLAFYIVYTTVRGIAGYFTKFIRFCLRLGPIIGLIGWVMSNSGQGDLGQVFDALKQYVGLEGNNNARGPGVEALFGKGRKPVSSRTRSKKRDSNKADDFLASMIGSATGSNAQVDDWSEIVKDYVKNSVAKASGLDWLFGTTKEEQGKGKGKTR